MKLADLTEQKNSEGGENPFYVSFSDLMVLLVVFFIMILGVSKVDRGAFEKIRTEFTGKTAGTLVELESRLQQIAAGQKGVTVELADDGVRLDLESAALFDTGSAIIKLGSLKPLEPLLLEIKGTDYLIDVEGHTDDRGFYRNVNGEIETNWSLSGRRASSMVHHLLELGIKRSRLRIVGYASTRPKVKPWHKSGDVLEAARTQNRRVSLLIH